MPPVLFTFPQLGLDSRKHSSYTLRDLHMFLSENHDFYTSFHFYWLSSCSSPSPASSCLQEAWGETDHPAESENGNNTLIFWTYQCANSLKNNKSQAVKKQRAAAGLTGQRCNRRWSLSSAEGRPGSFFWSSAQASSTHDGWPDNSKKKKKQWIQIQPNWANKHMIKTFVRYYWVTFRWKTKRFEPLCLSPVPVNSD